MQSVRLQITVPADHRVELELPEEVPLGPAEVIVFSRPARPGGHETSSEDVAAARERWAAMASDLRADPRPFQSLSEEERRVRLERLLGAGKGLLSSTEEFARWKQEEIDLEEEKFARRG